MSISGNRKRREDVQNMLAALGDNNKPNKPISKIAKKSQRNGLARPEHNESIDYSKEPP